MFKTLAAAAIASVIAAAAPVATAEAKTNLNFDIGIGFGGGYGGYYEPGYYGYPRYYEPAPVYVDRCGYARQSVRAHGFRNVRPLDCAGSRFAFKAKRHGDWWLVTTNSRGHISSVRPL